MKIKNTLYVIAILCCFLKGLISCNQQDGMNMKETKTLLDADASKATKEYRLSKIAKHKGAGHEYYYQCSAYPINKKEEKQEPDSIHLLLITKEYIDLMEQGEFLLSTSLVASFEYKGVHKSDKQPYINGFMTPNREIWELVKMEIK